MEPFRHHLFICTQQKPEGVASCPANNSWNVLRALERELTSRNLQHEIQVATCGCLGLCDDGPIVIVYPEGVWYRKVQQADIPEIVESHLVGGKTVARLAWIDAPAMKAQSIEHYDRFHAMLKARDQAGILPDDLYELTRAYMPSRVLLTALELDVFTAVGNAASATRVAQTIRADVRATEMLLNALVSLKLLDKNGDTFSNSPTAARFFGEDSRDNARPGLLHVAQIWHRWSTLTDAVRAGTSAGGPSRNNHWVENFIAAMDYNGRQRAAAVVKAVEPGAIKRMLDLGGGSGAYSITFARVVPELCGDFLDLGEVVPIAQKHIREAGLEGRINTRVGDMLSAPLGENYDLILLMAICHMFSPEENRALFQRARKALAPGGRLVIQDFVLEPDKTAPRQAALFALNMLVGTRAGATYSEPEYTNWLHVAGYTQVRRVRLPGDPSSLLIAST
jgi:(2Fe-2S) ferredoxin/SAM-dependent methyltransferase